MWFRAPRALLLCAAAACGGSYSGAPAAPAAPASASGLAAFALPYTILDRAGHQLDEPAFWSKLTSARAICVGEEHSNPHDHWFQFHVLESLAKAHHGGAPLALGMEMFQRPFQAVLDDYAAKKIDAAALLSRSGYADRWGYDYHFYGPTIDLAVSSGASLLALNAAKELTKQVSHHGLESLSPDQKAQLPELKLDDAAHRAWFDALMEEMGGTSAHMSKGEPPPDMPSADRIYTVQVIWDETMADTGAKWLASHPAGQLVILAGNGHCHDSAIVGRLRRRGVSDALSIRAVIDDGEGAVADALAKPMTDFVVALKSPPVAKPAEDHAP